MKVGKTPDGKIKYYQEGRIRWYSKHKGYGFIRLNSGEDAFFHHTVIKGNKKAKNKMPVELTMTNKEGLIKATEVLLCPHKK